MTMLTSRRKDGRKTPKGRKRRAQKPRKKMTYEQAIKVLIKHKILSSRRELVNSSRGSGGLLLGTI